MEQDTLGKYPLCLQAFPSSSPQRVLHEEVWEVILFHAFLSAWLWLWFPGCISYYFLWESWYEPLLSVLRQVGRASVCVSHLPQLHLASSIRNMFQDPGSLTVFLNSNSETQLQVQRWDKQKTEFKNSQHLLALSREAMFCDFRLCGDSVERHLHCHACGRHH